MPANAWLPHGSKGKLLTPAEAIAEPSVQGGAAVLKPETEALKSLQELWKKSANARRMDTKRKRNEAEGDKDAATKGKTKGGGKGKGQACYAWNNNNGACAGLPPGPVAEEGW